MERFFERLDDLAGVEATSRVTAWLDRIAFVFLVLMAVSAPHSIAATQISWLTGMLAYVIRLFVTRRERLNITKLDVALWSLFGWSVVTSIFSFAPDISQGKLRAVALFLIVYFVAGNIKKLRAGYFIAFMLILSCMVNVILTPVQRLIGRGVEVHGVSLTSSLPGLNIKDGDTILTVNKLKIASPEDILDAIAQTGRAELSVYKTDYEIPGVLTKADLQNGTTAEEKLGFTSWKRSHNWRSAGFYGHYTTYAEVLQLIMSLVLGLLVALFARKGGREKGRSGEGEIGRGGDKDSNLKNEALTSDLPQKRLPFSPSPLLLFSLGAMCLALVLTVTRASQLAFLISALCIVFVGLGRKWLLISVAVIIPVAFAGLFALQQTRQVGFFDQKDNSITWRQTVWREGAQLWTKDVHNFTVGVGMDSIKRFAPAWHLFDDGKLPMGHFHSTPLQIAVERGLPALLIWLTILGIYSRTLWRGIRSKNIVDWRYTGILLGCLGGMIGFFVSGLVHYNLGDSEVAMVFYLLMGLSVKLTELSPASRVFNLNNICWRKPMKTKLSRSVLSFLLLFSVVTISLPQIGYAQTASPADYSKQLQTIEEKTEARRKELGIPGMSLVIVKDDQIIYIKGLGYKDFEKKVVVTPDTQFAIGSATKAFTALSVLMSMDEGKLSLEDSPKKALPYFKMYDPETDKNITIRDLLSHSSGLNRTDLAMITGKLNRAELIQVAAQAKPTAKLREKFQYQNIMFTAAGQIVANVQKTPWEKFVPNRIFAPLDMNNSTMSMKQMQKAKDYSFGYDYNFDTKTTERRPFREIDQIAPAGSINSSAKDMAEWLRFVLNGGTVNGKRLVSEKGFDEWLKPQMKIAGTSSYGFGWFLQNWNGLKVVQHGGNIDGFNSMVAMIPEKKIGFVMLTNVSGSSLGNELMPIIWSNLLGNPKENTKLPVKTMEKMVGKYHLAEANIDIDVKIEGEDLVMFVPSQPKYVLERFAPRQFKPVGAPDGFSVKFTPEQGDANEMELTQPNRVSKLTRVAGETQNDKPKTAAARELIGNYIAPNGGPVEIKESGSDITFNIPGQQPYSLGEKTKDSYSLSPLPDSYSLKTKRDTSGKVVSVVVTQPEGEFEFKLSDGIVVDKPKMTADELMKKAIDAAGGEANWRKITSRVTEFEMDLENQGVQAFGTQYAKLPNKTAGETTFTALGKKIGTEHEYFDGINGEDFLSFAPADKYSGKRLEDVRLFSDFYSLLNWKTNYKTIEVTGTKKVGPENSEEEAYAVSFKPEKGTPYTEYYSTTTFLLLKRDGYISSSTSEQKIPYTVLYSDYREIDGIKLPYKATNNNIGNGNIVTIIKSYKHNVPLDDKLFAPRKVK